MLSKEIKKVQKSGIIDDLGDIEQLQKMLDETNQSIANITEIIVKGQMLESLLGRLTELEEHKKALQISILKMVHERELQQLVGEKIIDSKYILSEYSKAKEDVFSVRYKEFIQSFITSIDVSKYYVDITLKTGLGIFPKLDKTISVRRQEIYEWKGKVA